MGTPDLVWQLEAVGSQMCNLGLKSGTSDRFALAAAAGVAAAGDSTIGKNDLFASPRYWSASRGNSEACPQ